MIPEYDVDSMGRIAARLLLQGKARSISEAIALSGADHRLSHARVRKHLSLLEESIVGERSARTMRGELLTVALNCMEAVDEYLERFPDRFPEAKGIRLVGRAAEGYLEGEVTFHLRVFANIEIPELVELLLQLEAEDPIYSPFATQKFGSLNQLKTRVDGIAMIFTVCPPDRIPVHSGNLSTGGKIHSSCSDDIRTLRDQLLTDVRPGHSA